MGIYLNMIQAKKIGLLKAWENNPFSEFTLPEIMKLSGKKTKTWTFNSLKLLTKSRLLISRRKGNLDLYSLNLDNPLLIQTLQYLESQDLLGFPALDIITVILDKIPLKEYCLLVFGSYAEGRQREDSDLDICFLVKDTSAETGMRPYVNEVKLNHPVSIDEHYITFAEFVEMLLREEENLGKQIVRKHRLFYNADIYYQLIKGAYKNGFRP